MSQLTAFSTEFRDNAMQKKPEQQAWSDCRQTRSVQRGWGKLCALLLGLALVAMVDGLQGLMRSGSDVLEMLPGNRVTISGPLTIKNPVNSDIRVQFSPAKSGLAFDLEGFFAGYWFGNGMWRANVAADPAAEPGRYDMRVVFHGAPAVTAQHYTAIVYADESSMRSASASFVRRLTGYNPFVLAVGFCGLAMLVGVGVYRLGQSYIRQLAALGCGEIVMVHQEQQGGKKESSYHIWCLLYGSRPPAAGTACAVLDENGVNLGVARAGNAKKGTLEMVMENFDGAVDETGALSTAVQPGCLVRLRSQRPQSPPIASR